jgi:hypothetical protein
MPNLDLDGFGKVDKRIRANKEDIMGGILVFVQA